MSTATEPTELKPCPRSPNCVSTRDTDDQHRLEPLALEGDAAAAIDRFARIIDELPRTRIVSRTPRYLHAVFVSRVFRFKDDVEILIDEQARRIDMRSASRVGHSDLGANRKRMNDLIARYRAAD